jgi:GAF domain-containing protein
MGAAPDSKLADLRQIIADQQRQIAERTAERDEALAREAAMAEVLGVINSSTGALARIFEAILTKATGLCEAIYGTLCTFDGECFLPAAIHGDPQFADWLRQHSPLAPKPHSPFERIVQGERFVHIADTEKDSIYHSPGFRELVEIGRIRSHLAVALRKGHRLAGALVVFRREVHPFTDRQVALLLNFAEQAVIAMENARLLTETREALEQQTATAEVLQVINSRPGDLAPVFDAILEKAHTLCGAARGGLVLRDGARFRAVAMHGITEAFAEMLRHGFEPRENSPYGALIRGERSVHIVDLTVVAPRVLDDPLPRAAVELGGVRTLLMVALRNDGALLGSIVAMRQEVRPFTEKQIALLENFAAQAVIAMENARLLGELRASNEEIAALNRNLETWSPPRSTNSAGSGG